MPMNSKRTLWSCTIFVLIFFSFFLFFSFLFLPFVFVFVFVFVFLFCYYYYYYYYYYLWANICRCERNFKIKKKNLMLKVTSSLYTWIYFGFNTLRTMQYFSWGGEVYTFCCTLHDFFFFSFFLVATFNSKKKNKNKKKIKTLNLNAEEL